MGEAVAEAGWFHVEGDPPGTLRRWNGVEWIGFPIPDPSKPASLHGTAQHLQLSRRGALLSVAAIGAMSALATMFVLIAVTILRNLDNLRSPSVRSEVVVPLRNVGDYIGGIGVLLVLAAVGVVLSAATFTPWLRAAASAVQVRHLHAKRRPAPRRAGDSSLLTDIAIFEIFAPLWWLLNFAGDRAPRGGERSPSLLTVVSQTATASSTDPRTGLASIGPIRIMVWWALWWGPLLVGLALGVWLWIFGPLTAGLLANVAQLSAVLLALEAISLACIVITTAQITARLTR